MLTGGRGPGRAGGEREEEREVGKESIPFFFFFYSQPHPPAPNLQFVRRAASPLCVDVFSPRGEIVRKVVSPQR